MVLGTAMQTLRREAHRSAGDRLDHRRHRHRRLRRGERRAARGRDGRRGQPCGRTRLRQGRGEPRRGRRTHGTRGDGRRRHAARRSSPRSVDFLQGDAGRHDRAAATDRRRRSRSSGISFLADRFHRKLSGVGRRIIPVQRCAIVHPRSLAERRPRRLSAQAAVHRGDRRVAGREGSIHARASDSPVPEAQRATFPPLAYFPVNEEYRVPAALKVISSDQILEMPTSTGQAGRCGASARWPSR